MLYKCIYLVDSFYAIEAGHCFRWKSNLSALWGQSKARGETEDL